MIKLISLLAVMCVSSGCGTADPNAKLDQGGAWYRPGEQANKERKEKHFAVIEAMLTGSGRADILPGGTTFGDFTQEAYRLGIAMQPMDTERYLRLFSLAGDLPDAMKMLKIGLSFHGADQLSLPYFIEEVSKLTEFNHSGVYEFVWGAAYNVQELDGVATGYLMRSQHPDAIKFKLSLLEDAHGIPQLRDMAYVSIAGSKDRRALRAIQDIRNGDASKTLMPDGTEVTVKARGEQEILNAAADGLLRFLSRERPEPWIVTLLSGTTPFKFAFADRDVLIGPIPAGSAKYAWSMKLSYSRPTNDFDGDQTKEGDPTILRRSNRAKVGIRGGLDSAGYDIELEQIDDTWYVVMAKMAWVS